MIKVVTYFLFFAFISADQLKVPSAYSTIQAGLNAASAGDPVGAGVYLYQLQAKDFVKTRKMILLK